MFKKLMPSFIKCIEKYNLIEENDKIAVGLSGGKDSLVLLSLFAILKKFYRKKFDLIAITIDLFNGDSNYEKVIEYCKEIDVELHIVNSQIYSIVFEERKEKNPCSLCAKLRRGMLNTKAKELGCNKVALGHTKNDLVETFFLSLFYEGRLSTFAPYTYLSNVGLTVIRPLIFIDEQQTLSRAEMLPIFKNCCPANHKTQREYVKNLVAQIKSEIPISFDRIFRAIISPESYNLYDKYTTKD